MMRDFPEFFVMRHGETEWNAAGRFQGSLDSPLTARGRAQAVAMGRALATLGLDRHRWISSPMPRAVLTADLARGAPPDTTDPRLAEIGMGDWSGLTRADIDARWPGPADEGLMAFYARVAGGEPLSAVADRAGAFIASLHGPAVLVTHGITSRFLRGAVLGLPPDRLGDLPGGHGIVFRCTPGRVDIAATVNRLPDDATSGIAAV
jgi:probable phosphoglycerate mutase